MSRLIRGELIKLRTTRTALGFAAAVVIITVAVVLLTILAGKPTTVSDKRSAIGIGNGLAVILLLFGVVGAGAEYRHRTLAAALLVAPGRARLLVARLIAYALAGLVIGVLMTVVTFVIAIPLLSGRPGPDLAGSDYLTVGGGGLIATVLCTTIGVGAGTLVGKQVPAVIGAMVWLFILEPLTGLIDHIDKFTIGQTVTALAGETGGPHLLPWAGALLVEIAWTALFLGAAAFVDRRRDIA